MSINVFPVPVAKNALTLTIPLDSRRYALSEKISPGIYDITCPSTVVANFELIFGSSITKIATSSGTVRTNIASSPNNIYCRISAGTDVLVTLTKIADPLNTGAISGGTLDTITSSQTYNQTGFLYVMAVGGGGGGGYGASSNTPASQRSGQGGFGGENKSDLLITNNSTTITIGAAGTGRTGSPGNGNAGGATSFGNLLVASGGDGGLGNISYDGGAGGGTISASTAQDLKSGNNGGGGHGQKTTFGDGVKTGGTGAGSGIGTGGNGGNTNSFNDVGNAANAGSGYGAGGGGGSVAANSATDGAGGTAGVVYVLRGFNIG